jgi:tRNA G18 (ribose-2'-O)-methylase SpoU
MHAYHIRECLAESCRFRYPVLPAEMPAERCPRCGGETALRAAQTVEREAAPTVPAAATADGPPVVALLDNIRSVFNVGSMFRIASGAGLGHLHLAGITPTPAHPKLVKTALGAEGDVPWTYHPNALLAAEALRAQGHRLWALERSAAAESLFAPFPPKEQPLTLIVGHERVGVDPELLALCDRIVCIPMQGRKRSLNVAVAFGIAAYAVRFQRLAQGR